MNIKMNTWLKSPDTLVLRGKGGSGLVLVNQLTKQRQLLNEQQAASWVAWDDASEICTDPGRLGRLLFSGGFIVSNNSSGSTLNPLEIDACIPDISGNNIKWYEESPDLLVLFNTQQVSSNNALLALGPYGSLCWRGVISGWSVGRIRREALRVFGCDEAVPFLKRLVGLGFIKEIEEIGRYLLPVQQATKEFAAPDVQFQLSQSLIPWYCLWEICTACDLRCKICYLPHFKDIGPNREDALRLAQQIIDSGIFYVSILGGEPLIREDLEQLIGHLRATGVFVKVISNGQTLTPDRARALANVGLNQIEISFDGLSSDSHQKSRGSGTFVRASQAIRHAQKAGILRVGVVWTVHAGNLAELASLPGFMHELGVTECYISLFKKTGLNGAKAPFGPVGAEGTHRIRQQISEWKVAFPELTVALLPACSCGRTSVVIGHDGNVRLCTFSYESVGNIYRTQLAGIWRSLENALPETGPLGYCTALTELRSQLIAQPYRKMSEALLKRQQS
jgi:MoaA/NifB/PqqE/SkfB family radical SAM enzyme